MCLSSGERLAEHGAGLDLACPCVVEYDVADPGGLDARRTLSRPDLTPDAIQALLSRLAGHG